MLFLFQISIAKSELLDKMRDKFQSNFMLYALVYCIILASRHNVLMYLR